MNHVYEIITRIDQLTKKIEVTIYKDNYRVGSTWSYIDRPGYEDELEDWMDRTVPELTGIPL